MTSWILQDQSQPYLSLSWTHWISLRGETAGFKSARELHSGLRGICSVAELVAECIVARELESVSVELSQTFTSSKSCHYLTASSPLYPLLWIHAQSEDRFYTRCPAQLSESNKTNYWRGIVMVPNWQAQERHERQLGLTARAHIYLLFAVGKLEVNDNSDSWHMKRRGKRRKEINYALRGLV